MSLFALLLFRVASLNFSEYSEAAESKSTRTVIVGNSRGKIYDRNFEPLVDEKHKLIAVVTPCVGIGSFLKQYLSTSELTEKIEDGYPFMLEVREQINNELIRTFSVPQRYSENSLASHVVGYVNSDGEGVSGIEKAFNEYLKENSGELSVTFEVDALGRVLAGMNKTINDNGFTSKAGVVLTIDKDIQKLTEEAMNESKIKSGCAVVMKAHTGEILALSSVPDFDRSNVSAYLNSENSPLMNKALLSYAPGSVFKPLVAAAAMEHGIDSDFVYECKGEIKIGDTVFSCYNHNAHGKINMTEALEQSCNTYFVNLIMHTDTELLLSLCEKLGIAKSEKLASSIISSSGKLPDRKAFSSKGALANFSFGQGELLITPLKMAEIYHLLATGNAVQPKLVAGITNAMGLMTAQKDGMQTKLLSDSTVIKMRQMLKSVVKNGNAKKAFSDLVSLSGKTGTAQSGIYIKEKEVCRTWFAGFFPSDNPNYIIIVMNENGSGGNSDCAPVFKKICEGIVTR